MRPHQKGNFVLGVLLVAALVGVGTLVPMAWRHRTAPPDQAVRAVPAPPASAPAPAALPEAPAAPAIATAPTESEMVPPEESETDRSPNAASPGGPVLSFGRAKGLHLAPDPLKLNSSAALVLDQSTGEVLVRKNDQTVLPMASLTKLMTALVVAEAGQPMDEVLTITDEDVDRQRNSRSRVRVGSTLTREEALHVALMSSENRAAHALGRAYPGGLEKMVEAMNARARTLGMHNTTYADPTGLSNRNQSTARDLALLVNEVARNPVLSAFSVDREHVASMGQRTLQYRNSNRLVRNANSGWDIRMQKTGYIVEAGRCLAMMANVAGHNLVMVLLDADSNTARLADAQRLRRWVVAENGWEDKLAVAAAQAADKPAKRKASAGGKSGDGKRKTAVASKNTTGKKGSKAVAAAKKEGAGKNGRVRQSFASGKDGTKG